VLPVSRRRLDGALAFREEQSRRAIGPTPELTRGSDSPSRLSWAPRGEQTASEEPVLDSGELRAALTLTELEPARWLERTENVRRGD
jgi:hypothetical protein